MKFTSAVVARKMSFLDSMSDGEQELSEDSVIAFSKNK